MDADALWGELSPDDSGLVAAIIVDADHGDVRMLGYMNRAALDATRARGRVVFFSRSRRALWEKGETSGNTLEVVGIRVDCDGDALLIHARPAGPTCHTGARACFYRRLEDDGLWADDGPPLPVSHATTLADVMQTIEARKAGRGMTQKEGKSYVRSLLDAGVGKINEKIAEETAELTRAIRREPDERVLAEAADLVFHVLVGLSARNLPWESVEAVLRARMGISGIDEKASRDER
jgi:phosphoribosyl-ATP pyrophosphohydrolase/phosphoribosyl-AMP cyclohydrolase